MFFFILENLDDDSSELKENQYPKEHQTWNQKATRKPLKTKPGKLTSSIDTD